MKSDTNADGGCEMFAAELHKVKEINFKNYIIKMVSSPLGFAKKKQHSHNCTFLHEKSKK